jgi:hypothetical protein
VFLAALTEFLCKEFQIIPPSWINREEFILKIEWDAMLDLDEFPWMAVVSIEERRERAAPEFLKRNIVFES